MLNDTLFILKIMSYICSDSKTPIVVVGNPGSGKSSLLSKIISQVKDLNSIQNEYFVIFRFLGISYDSSNAFKTLQSIAYQLSRLFNLKTKEINFNRSLSKTDLKDYLLELFETAASSGKKLVIILDGIDQLDMGDHSLDWAIFAHSSNIKIIYSVSSDKKSIVERLKQNLKKSHFIYLNKLDVETSKNILTEWMNKKNKRLSNSQSLLVNQILEKYDGNPLTLKLLFDIITKWRSNYEPNIDLDIFSTSENLIDHIFNSLERDHGKIIFQKVILYTSSFKSGISESEIEDVLSLVII